MSASRYVLLAALVVLTTAGVDFAHARYSRAVVAGAAPRAAMWSLLQWCATSVGFVCAVYVSPWLLPFEAVGLVIGTLLGVGRGTSEAKGESLS